ncbi:hypothetical protein C8N37_106121 [Sphingobacterium faecium]|nr:hypothetical protein C8N37_106121 [Sphingobacterium faecium]
MKTYHYYYCCNYVPIWICTHTLMPLCRFKEMHIYNCNCSGLPVWLFLALIGRVVLCSTMQHIILLCIMTKDKELSNYLNTNLCLMETAQSRFFHVNHNPESSGFLCSPEHGKLCFAHLEMISDAQNYLPLQGAENTFRSQGV